MRQDAAFVVLLPGRFDTTRAARADDDEIARNELTEFERRLDAEIVDFGAFDEGWFARVVGRVGRALGAPGELLPFAAWRRLPSNSTVYATSEGCGFVLAVLLLLVPWRRTRLIVRVENPVYGSNRLKRSVYTALAWLAVRRIDAVLCRSVVHADKLRHWAPHPDRVRAVSQEVDLRYHRSGSSECAADDDLPDEFVFSAGLEQRDYSTLFEAVRGLDVDLVVAASSPWSSDAFEVDEYPPNVTIRKFDVSRMRDVYRCASVVVLTVRPTTRICGMSVVGEAWANGRPVIAAAEGIYDHVHAAGGVALRPGDVEGVRRAISELIRDPERAAQMGDAGRRYAEQHLSLDSFVDLVESIHRDDRE